MSNTPNHSGDGEHRGGHELQGIDASTLFRVTFGLSAVTLIASILVAQWFYRQRDELSVQRAGLEDKVLLKYHRKEMQERLNGISSTINDVHSRQLLDAQPAPPGWIHPDDIGKAVPAAVPGAADPSAPAQPVAGEAKPTDPAQPAGTQPTGQPAAGQPAAAQLPAAQPAAGQPPAGQPAGTKPTQGH